MNPYYFDRLLLLLGTDNLFCMLFPACAGWDASQAYRWCAPEASAGTITHREQEYLAISLPSPAKRHRPHQIRPTRPAAGSVDGGFA